MSEGSLADAGQGMWAAAGGPQTANRPTCSWSARAATSAAASATVRSGWGVEPP
jgi:hypothetical protein